MKQIKKVKETTGSSTFCLCKVTKQNGKVICVSCYLYISSQNDLWLYRFGYKNHEQRAWLFNDLWRLLKAVRVICCSHALLGMLLGCYKHSNWSWFWSNKQRGFQRFLERESLYKERSLVPWLGLCKSECKRDLVQSIKLINLFLCGCRSMLNWLNHVTCFVWIHSWFLLLFFDCLLLTRGAVELFLIIVISDHL